MLLIVQFLFVERALYFLDFFRLLHFKQLHLLLMCRINNNYYQQLLLMCRIELFNLKIERDHLENLYIEV